MFSRLSDEAAEGLRGLAKPRKQAPKVLITF